MAVIISSTNNKGGVGKTTTVVNLSTILAQDFQKRVLVIDLDQQCNLSQALLGKSNFDGETKNSGELFNLDSEYGVKDLIIESNFGVDIIPGRLDDLFLMEKELFNLQDKIKNNYLPLLKEGNTKKIIKDIESKIDSKGDWIKILKKRISEVIMDYDYIFYDLPPSVSRVPKNAWVSSNYLLIPISDYFSLNGTEGLINKMIEIKRDYNNDLKFIFLFNKVPMTSNMWRKDSVNKEYNKIIEQFSEAINNNTFLSNMSYIMDTKIRSSPDLEKIYGMNNVLANVEESKILQDYKDFTNEFLNIT